ncbi:MAG: sn-glycerol-1-phosphate dehydrogenase [Tyzzerella sp.]|nr:sn-glycerol-1-phosphate dehydrogenase [Tyzzerella sp.]
METNFEFVKEFSCTCGKTHTTQVDDVIVGNGVLLKLPEVIKKYQAKKAFILADENTYKAAGERVCEILNTNGIAYSKYVYEGVSPEPDEHAVGSAIMHYDSSCDIIVAVGSGVMNDIGKIVCNTTGHPYIIVATAPSMDGYASGTSSMAMDGLKVSLNSACANVIIGDVDIMKEAPLHMLKAGLGDMLAKYVSICEWRIANVITGEYYCETIASMVRSALKKCADNAEGLLKREDEAVKAVFEGLIIGGVAMSYAGVSRPASGVEHYFSHVWDMRALEFGTNMDLHGIQCAIGTLLASRLYEQIKEMTPDKEKALAYAKAFDYADWSSCLREFLGKSAEAMIALEAKERKYDPELHAERLEIILNKWDEILGIMGEELPSSAQIEKLLTDIDAPKTVEEIGLDSSSLGITFKATKDIRDKYVLSRLAWDLGVIDELVI